jgi:hypothetical protein
MRDGARVMSRCLGGILGVVALLLAAACPVAARTQFLNYKAVGSLDYVWTGAASRDCAAQGMCGVEGSLQVQPDGSSGGGSGQPQANLGDSNAVPLTGTRAFTDDGPPGGTL